jgi:hypothetical protein
VPLALKAKSAAIFSLKDKSATKFSYLYGLLVSFFMSGMDSASGSKCKIGFQIQTNCAIVVLARTWRHTISQ